jgi:phosphoglycolate phosphatase-like HAD superfamily hydrolase
MHILAIDFDGVICDSAREVFAVSLQAYASINPVSGIILDIEQRCNQPSWQSAHLLTEPMFQRFLQLMPLGNRAEDYGVVLESIERNTPITDQVSYDAFRATLAPSWLDEFHRLFYEHRAVLRSDLEGWLALHSPYGWFVDLLEQRAGRAQYAIATAKDSESVDILLHHFGISGLFGPDLILDKNTGEDKADHLEELARRTEAGFEDITFVDDKVRHLLAVIHLGVRPILAGWGYNTQREHTTAVQHGLAVADFDNADNLLFGDSNSAVLHFK